MSTELPWRFVYIVQHVQCQYFFKRTRPHDINALFDETHYCHKMFKLHVSTKQGHLMNWSRTQMYVYNFLKHYTYMYASGESKKN